MWYVCHCSISYTPFPSQGVIDLVLDCIDRLHQYSSASHFAEAAQSDTGEEWETILNRFYELLGENLHTSSEYRWLSITFHFQYWHHNIDYLLTQIPNRYASLMSTKLLILLKIPTLKMIHDF